MLLEAFSLLLPLREQSNANEGKEEDGKKEDDDQEKKKARTERERNEDGE